MRRPVCLASLWLLTVAAAVWIGAELAREAPRGAPVALIAEKQSAGPAGLRRPVGGDNPASLPGSPASLPGSCSRPRTRPADNKPCYVCHLNYLFDTLVSDHAKSGIGCIKCHGESSPHRNDEYNLTPPDKMYPPETVNAACGSAECHPKHTAPAVEVLALWQKRCGAKTDLRKLVCTDCHGDHRLTVRTVQWDKRTGEEILPEWVGVRKPGGRAPCVVFLTGDKEYRSEESMPMLAGILRRDFGFRTVGCFAVDDQGRVDPQNVRTAAGIGSLEGADLLVMFLRRREYPWETLKHVLDYAESGRPIVAFRTSTAPFRYRGKMYPRKIPGGKAAYTVGVFGDVNTPWVRRVLGQIYCGHHAPETGTAVEIVAEQREHPILRGVKPFVCRSWLYKTEPFEPKVTLLLRGRSVDAKQIATSRPARIMEPHPVAWLWSYKTTSGKQTRVFYTSLGHPEDFQAPSFRRLAVNAILHLLGRPVPSGGAYTNFTRGYNPNPHGAGSHKRNVEPADLFKPRGRQDDGMSGMR